MPRNNSYQVYFVYSESQISEDTAVAESMGKTFVIGQVFAGSIPKRYSKMIKQDDLDAMVSKYPDTRIIAKGSSSELKHTSAYIK